MTLLVRAAIAYDHKDRTAKISDLRTAIPRLLMGMAAQAFISASF